MTENSKQGSKHSVTKSAIVNGKSMVIKQGNSFGVFDRYGDIHPSDQESQGVFHNNTRFISKLVFGIDNKRPLYLSSTLDSDNEILRVDLSNPMLGPEPDIDNDKGILHIHVTKFLWEKVFYHQMKLFNYGRKPILFTITYSFDADFKDIFEIRGIKRNKEGEMLTPSAAENKLCLSYRGLDNITRRTCIKFVSKPDKIEGKQATYKVTINPKEETFIYFSIAFEEDNDKPEVLDFEAGLKKVITKERIKEGGFSIRTDNEDFNDWLDRSKADLDMMSTSTEYGLYPYAGVPWYSTPFGRDAIVTSFECLWIEPELARGVLNFLANTQATKHDDFSEADPGKIFHEMRNGEMANTGEVPFKRYYGTIDATPLFISLAGHYYQRTGDIKMIKDLWPHIENGLEWMDKYGDLDGDGYLEYKKKSSTGLTNQGWKDSEDSVFYENGDLAKAPIALCEVQGFSYEAKLMASLLAEALGYSDKAKELNLQSKKLKDKFVKDFWSKDKNTFVIALDGDKKQCNVRTSNAGQCLATGIADSIQAGKIRDILMSSSMYSGYGIRTVAEGEVRYNPMSYHNGSVWPHDNALIAYGLSLYGFTMDARKICEGIFNAAKHMEQSRLPELFCGFKRVKNQEPVGYPVACSPQAWAIASVYMLLQACLGVSVDAKNKIIRFKNPVMPESINEIYVDKLIINGSSLSLHIVRNGSGVVVNTIDNSDNIKIKIGD
jgi:glycogen debranching enzyme